MIDLLLLVLLAISVCLNFKAYSDLNRYKRAYKNTRSIMSGTTLLMGALAAAPYIIDFIKQKQTKK